METRLVLPAWHGWGPVKGLCGSPETPICSTVPVWYDSHYQLVLGQAEGKRRGWSLPHSLVCAWFGGGAFPWERNSELSLAEKAVCIHSNGYYQGWMGFHGFLSGHGPEPLNILECW